MPKELSPVTRVYLIDPQKGYIGYNMLANLVIKLAEIYHSKEIIEDIVKTLESRGYVTSQDTQDYPYWVVEKAIPFDLARKVRENKITLKELLPQLKM